MKDTFYFTHDYNSRSDIKIKKLIRQHGPTGYGIYWMLVEDLYNNSNEMPLDYDGIAYEYRCNTDIIESIINEFELFIVDDDTFGSLSVQKRLNERDEKSKKARESASKRWGLKDNDTNAMRSHSDSNAIKERKEKEKKGNEIKETHGIAIDDVVFYSTDVGSTAVGFSFEDLIEVYPKLNSYKAETLGLFNQLNDKEKKKCITFAKQLQRIWKQNGIQDKYQFMKSCHTFVEDKMFNGNPKDIFPREISTEVVNEYTKEELEWLEKNKNYKTPIERFREQQQKENI